MVAAPKRPTNVFMSDDNERQRPSGNGWTLETLQLHWTAIDKINHEWNEKFDHERDRRYTEISVEREKALKIKEEADKSALGLAREIQVYKDEKANQLREQINSERGLYATKDDLNASMRELQASITPLNSFVAGQAGETRKSDSDRTNIVSVAAVVYSLIATIGAIAAFVAFLLHR